MLYEVITDCSIRFGHKALLGHWRMTTVMMRKAMNKRVSNRMANYSYCRRHCSIGESCVSDGRNGSNGSDEPRRDCLSDNSAGANSPVLAMNDPVH